MPERFAAGLTPLPTAARVTRARGALRWRIISTFISAAIFGAFWWFFGREMSQGWLIGIGILWLASTVFWLVVSIVGLSNAKRDLGRIPEGVAFYLDNTGVEFAWPTQAAVAWDDVSTLKLIGRSVGSRGPDVGLFSQGKEVARVPLSFLDATAEVIDSAARAYSLGKASLDVSALNRVV